MIVYQVYGWDSMASNWGEPYLDSTWAEKAKADERAKFINDQARADWMKRAPHSIENYRDQAHVHEIEVQ